jgi:hypothetical protein
VWILHFASVFFKRSAEQLAIRKLDIALISGIFAAIFWLATKGSSWLS